MKNYILFIVLILSAKVSAQDLSPSKTINWLSFEQLNDSLAVHPKPVFIFFHTDWCAYCRKMDREVFTKPEVIATLNADFYAVHFDAESVDTLTFDGQILHNTVSKKTTGKFHQMAELLAARPQGLAFPTTLILDKDFTLLTRKFTYLSAKNMLKLLTKTSIPNK